LQAKKPADIFVSETFDSGLIGENFLSILAHAKTERLIKRNAVVIPHSATVFGQLLETTFSLRRAGATAGGSNRFEGPDGAFRMGISLEAMRHKRVANTFTVRYLNERNAVRQKLSAPQTLFDYNFQDFDVRHKDFAYSCVVFEVTVDGTEKQDGGGVVGVVDSIGLFFNLYLDRNRTIVVSNAPSAVPLTVNGSEARIELLSMDGDPVDAGAGATIASCWMQAMYRLSTDVQVKRGDVLRLQIVQQSNVFIFGDVGVGRYNQHSRLVKFTAVGCSDTVYIHTSDAAVLGGGITGDDDDTSAPPVENDPNTDFSRLVGEIPSSGGGAGNFNPFKVLSSRVGQQFRLSTVLPSGKRIGMLYQVPGSRASISKAAAVRKLSLDSFDISCPASF
jgi:hypothetical protein